MQCYQKVTANSKQNIYPREDISESKTQWRENLQGSPKFSIISSFFYWIISGNGCGGGSICMWCQWWEAAKWAGLLISTAGNSCTNYTDIGIEHFLQNTHNRFLISYMLSRAYTRKSIFTVVIHKWRSHVCQFVLARTINKYDVTMSVPHIHVTSQINCGDATMLSQEKPSLATMAKSAIYIFFSGIV